MQSLDAQFSLEIGLHETAPHVRNEQLRVVEHFSRGEHEILFYVEILYVLDQQIEFFRFIFREGRRIHEYNGWCICEG